MSASASSGFGTGQSRKSTPPPPPRTGAIRAWAVRLCVLAALSPASASTTRDPALLAENNRGVGLMGRYEYAEALALFRGLVEDHPDWLEAKVNFAIAMLNRNLEGDEERALEILQEVLAVDPGQVRARYCAGLLLLRAADERAVPYLAAVVEADPADAYAHYHYARALEQASRGEEALVSYRQSLREDPYLMSGCYRLAQLLLRSGQRQEAVEYLDRFRRLQKNPLGRTVEFVYTKMGPKAEALALGEPSAPGLATRPGPVLAPPRPLLTTASAGQAWVPPGSDRPPCTTACDIDGDGRVDLFVTGVLHRDSGAVNAVILNGGPAGFTLDPDHPLARIPGIRAVLWGDFDNDDLTDAYLCRSGPNQLWRQHAPRRWEDVTAATGTSGGDHETVDGAFVDADHDGDLDIFCVNADGPNELLNNDRDGTFRPIAADRGISGDASASRQVLVADLDGDRDLDLVVIHESPPHDVYRNDLGWEYSAAPGFAQLRSAPIRALVAGDLEPDGQVDLISRDPAGHLSLWRRGEDGAWGSVEFGTAPGDAPAPSPECIALADLDGDGRLAAIWRGPDGWVSRGLEPATARSLTTEPGLRLSSWDLVVLDPGGGPSVVGISTDGVPWIWDPGAGRHMFAALAFTGREDTGKSLRSNTSGIGTRFVVRAGTGATVGTRVRATSGPGQSLQPIAVGLGTQSRIDLLSVLWPDGVLQSEVDLVGGELHRIAETQRQLSSCPVLFAWNGDRFAFVSDLLGVGGLGYMVAPGEYAPPRPWENLLLPPAALEPRDGRYLLKLAEPMEETCYLDAARLVVHDLPPGWKMTLDERMGILGPEPTGEPRYYRRETLPIRATNDRGEDVTPAVVTADRVAPPVGPLDERFIGRLREPHALVLEFPRPLDSPPGQPLLVVDGWVEYPYSQTMFGAWQAGADYVAPSVEARASDGAWHRILDRFGYPAGMPRQMSVPLPQLPGGCTALRITTNQEIYWDRLAVVWAEPCPRAIRHSLAPDRARLLRSGFPERTTAAQRVPSYDYRRRRPFWDTRPQQGYYTRFGPVLELVSAADDALAIFGPGEEVHLEFAPPEDPPPAGWNRRIVLETVGWCKDMDLYTKDGETVGPLPSSGADTGPRDRLHARFNTRHSGCPF